jgi:diguanylate cyclase
VLALLLVAVVAWQLRPLTQLEHRAGRLLQGNDSDRWPESAGEIGRLATTLRHVWAERTQADRFTADIMQKLMSVLGASPVGLAFVRHQKFELISAECCRMLRREEAELCGRPSTRRTATKANGG